MAEWIIGMFGILVCLFEGYCIQSFFGKFAKPKLCRLRNADWAVGIVWIVIRTASDRLFSDTNSVALIMELLFTFSVLFVFCVCWYKGNILLKVFLSIQFISLRELSFWTGYSLLYIGNGLIEMLVHTGNAVSDAVVGSKFRYAAKKVNGIKLDAGGFMLTDAVTIKAYDMGIILNNGLDNAIEACMRMREKQPDSEAYITIRSFKAKNMYFIEIENSFDGVAPLRKDSGFPISIKEDKEVHGIGLKNIRKCAVKYGGDMDCIVKGNKFTLSVMVKS